MYSLLEYIFQTSVCGVLSDLVVLQQDKAEVELAEGQLQVFDIAMFAALLLRQVEDSATTAQARGSTALPLRVQRRLQLIL